MMGGVLPGMWDLHMCLSFLGLLHSLFGGAVKDCRKSLPPPPSISSPNECASEADGGTQA